jgi:hypothetical protein
MAAEENGTLSEIPRVKRELVITSFGWTSECRGESRTSSNVKTTSLLTLGNPFSSGTEDLMRESPLPVFAGVAGFFDVDGRVVVAIAKGMAMFRFGLEVRTQPRRLFPPGPGLGGLPP